MRRRETAILLLLILLSPLAKAQKQGINQCDKNGLKTGEWIAKRENGSIKYKGYFTQGHPVGKLYRYYPDGKTKAILDFSITGDTTQAFFIYPNGKKAAQGEYIKKKKNGTWRTFATSGQVISVLNFKDNQLDGTAKTFYENGNLKTMSIWRDDNLNGNKFEYYKEGALLSRSQYKNGIEFGIHRMLYRDGKVRFEGSVEQGLKQGPWRYYKTNGELQCELRYKDDKLLNPETLEGISQDIIPTKEESKNKALDPNDFKYNPMEYIQSIRKTQNRF
ncbi:toxin-antitoxin system YwqK family antitoxin [Halosquirtibacter laminarini]|uniref:Toxin-antitoxin system YwqK family antitoxin n=1 Tax=Halosquirtibacter laminarini TaxID=3374600 RepID=A0AC61NG42_9BACT|nr:toxin-antitoxin system YwqK family antitoxin [Prolixibacteraceae bacterium]